MSEQILVGLIGCFAALLGSIVGAVATYKASKHGYDIKKSRIRLKETLKNLAIFYELEKRYSAELARCMNSTPTAIKNKIRDAVNDAGFGRLTTETQPARVKRMLDQLDNEI